MPVYLVHGFRWGRQDVRVHVILQNLNDVAPDWLMAPHSQKALRASLTDLYPLLLAELPGLQFVEEYELDQTTICADHAYVADTAIEVKASIDVDEARGVGMSNEAWSAITELRDKLAPKSKLGWWIVNCADEARSLTEEPESEPPAISQDNGFVERRARGSSFSKGLKKVFGKKDLKKSSSMKDLKQPAARRASRSDISQPMGATTPSPPPPAIPAQYQAEMAKLKANNVGGGVDEAERERTLLGTSKSSTKQVQQPPPVTGQGRGPLPVRPSTSGAVAPGPSAGGRARGPNGIGRAQ